MVVPSNVRFLSVRVIFEGARVFFWQDMNDDETCYRNRLESIEQLGTYSSKAEVTPWWVGSWTYRVECFFWEEQWFQKWSRLSQCVFFFPKCSPGNLGKIVQLLKTFRVYHFSSKSCKKNKEMSWWLKHLVFTIKIHKCFLSCHSARRWAQKTSYK